MSSFSLAAGNSFTHPWRAWNSPSSIFRTPELIDWLVRELCLQVFMIDLLGRLVCSCLELILINDTPTHEFCRGDLVSTLQKRTSMHHLLKYHCRLQLALWSCMNVYKQEADLKTLRVNNLLRWRSKQKHGMHETVSLFEDGCKARMRPKCYKLKRVARPKLRWLSTRPPLPIPPYSLPSPPLPYASYMETCLWDPHHRDGYVSDQKVCQGQITSPGRAKIKNLKLRWHLECV